MINAKKFMLVVLIFGMFLFPVNAAALGIEPESARIEIGDEITVSLYVEDVIDLFSFEFDFVYNSSIVSLENFGLGGFLTENGQVSLMCMPVTQGDGFIQDYSCNRGIGGTGINGSGSLVEFTFLAIANGSTNLELNNVLLLDNSNPQYNGNIITDLDIFNGFIQVGDEVIINEEPIVNFPSSLTIFASENDVEIDLDDYVIDPEGNSLSYEIVNFPSIAVCGIINGADLSCVRKNSGTDYISISVSDGENIVLADIEIIVEEEIVVNKPPISSLPDSLTISLLENSTKIILDIYFYDPEGDSLTYKILAQSSVADCSITSGSVEECRVVSGSKDSSRTCGIKYYAVLTCVKENVGSDDLLIKVGDGTNNIFESIEIIVEGEDVPEEHEIIKLTGSSKKNNLAEQFDLEYERFLELSSKRVRPVVELGEEIVINLDMPTKSFIERLFDLIANLLRK